MGEILKKAGHFFLGHQYSPAFDAAGAFCYSMERNNKNSIFCNIESIFQVFVSNFACYTETIKSERGSENGNGGAAA